MMRQFAHYWWGTIARPGATFEALAAGRSPRWAIILAAVSLLQGWGNMALHAAFGLDWLGTRQILSNPTFVGGFGHLRIDLASWVPIFAALLPLLGLLQLVIMPGIAQLMSRLWEGHGSFEQTVAVLTFATGVPALTIGAASEWLFSVPMSLLSGHDYWWVAAMEGDFGPVVAVAWNGYVIGVYATLQYTWAIALGSLAIRRIQKVPLWAATVIMSVSFGAWMVIVTTFVR
jgi:hypothetical protein